MKVLTVISKLEMGGIEKTLLSCMPFLIENGVEMSILCSLGGALDDDFKKLGVNLIDFGNFKKPFKDAKFLENILSNNEFDIVHSRYGHTSGGFAKVCAKMNIPLLVSIHNEKAMFRNAWIGKPFLEFLRKQYLAFHKRETIKYATKIIGHSRANLNYYDVSDDDLTDNKSKYVLLYNGVDFSKFSVNNILSEENKERLDTFRENFSKVLIHIGSFKEQKNHLYLINIFNKLKPVQNKYGLILMGTGERFEEIRTKVRELNIESNVLFTGMETDISPYLSASDLFVFPSLYEGFGNVLIEAQYAKVPVAASSIAPHFEAVYKGYHPFMYSPIDENEGFQSLENLLANDNTIVQQEAFLFAKRFSIENMSENLFTIYRGVKN